MLTFSITIEPHTGYHNEVVGVDRTSHEPTLTLEDGTHTVVSDDFDLGVLHAFEGRRLIGHLEFTYTYDESGQTVTICGSDFSSIDAMSLVTTAQGTAEHCRHWAAPSGFADDDLANNLHWNCQTPLTPGLKDVLSELARSANDALISSLELVAGLIVRVRTAPPRLSPEEHRQIITALGGWNHSESTEHRTYDPGALALTIQSIWGGEVTMNTNENFANVIGSTHDPKIGGLTWIQLWANQFGMYPNGCTSHHSRGFPCGTPIVGGHVVSGTVARAMPTGSDSVYIFPICHQHNMDDHVFMSAIKYQKGVWLKHYLQANAHPVMPATGPAGTKTTSERT